jgi:hypothetical protein
MSGGMAMFQSELRSAVRDVRETGAAQAAPAPRSTPPTDVRSKVTVLEPEAGRPARRGSWGQGANGGKRTVVRLWLPLTPLWIILAPFALLLAPVLWLLPPLLPNRPGARAVRTAVVVRPFRTAFALGAVLLAMSGTVVDVDTPDAVVRIRIF